MCGIGPSNQLFWLIFEDERTILKEILYIYRCAHNKININNEIIYH